MKRYLLFLVALVLLWPAIANAQPPRDRGRDDRSERVARVIKDCEQRTNDFLKAVERAWGGDRHTNDELDRSAAKLEREFNRIRDSWNHDHDYQRTRRNVGGAIDAGKDINKILSHHRLGSHVDKEWSAIRNELNNLADVFEQSRIRW